MTTKEPDYFLPDANQDEYLSIVVDPENYHEPDYVRTLGLEPFKKALTDLDFLKAHNMRRVEEAPPESGYTGPGIIFKEEDMHTLLDDVVKREVSRDLMSLVEKGYVDYYWSEKENDFVFSAIQ